MIWTGDEQVIIMMRTSLVYLRREEPNLQNSPTVGNAVQCSPKSFKMNSGARASCLTWLSAMAKSAYCSFNELPIRLYKLRLLGFRRLQSQV